jgi:hypothetical protein
LKLESDQNLCEQLGQNGRKIIEEENTFEKIGARLSYIINKLVN